MDFKSIQISKVKIDLFQILLDREREFDAIRIVEFLKIILWQDCFCPDSYSLYILQIKPVFLVVFISNRSDTKTC